MREKEIIRRTKETDISLSIGLDNRGEPAIETGIPFMDHMLTACAHHGGFALRVAAEGDLDVDAHHLVEDLGIVMGAAIREAIGEGKGIVRFAHAAVPMDEALAEVVLDIGGRSYLVWNGEFNGNTVGGIDTTLFRHFFEGLCGRGGITAHIRYYGRNDHHMAEAIFKAFGIALGRAAAIDPAKSGVPSTKGTF
ncbi:imidazoleglycerol-phosphate dehydratase HisB [Methanofollis fontis]|uniref:Imidazoleglycerol-phosphate dehydratase n=1 Tax=Methanofollis fontis TaxID=2052832 RepID=A0A483CUK7_9EURY|nr:imidazoleglycerol-phosphate dehydratase HisB [Methanofollis fontis]TAJ44607.1 imidazoleglycerol-phosphate dehydratase HisB [Methanofollis fontis]